MSSATSEFELPTLFDDVKPEAALPDEDDVDSEIERAEREADDDEDDEDDEAELDEGQADDDEDDEDDEAELDEGQDDEPSGAQSSGYMDGDVANSAAQAVAADSHEAHDGQDHHAQDAEAFEIGTDLGGSDGGGGGGSDAGDEAEETVEKMIERFAETVAGDLAAAKRHLGAWSAVVSRIAAVEKDQKARDKLVKDKQKAAEKAAAGKKKEEQKAEKAAADKKKEEQKAEKAAEKAAAGKKKEEQAAEKAAADKKKEEQKAEKAAADKKKEEQKAEKAAAKAAEQALKDRIDLNLAMRKKVGRVMTAAGRPAKLTQREVKLVEQADARSEAARKAQEEAKTETIWCWNPGDDTGSPLGAPFWEAMEVTKEQAAQYWVMKGEAKGKGKGNEEKGKGADKGEDDKGKGADKGEDDEGDKP